METTEIKDYSGLKGKPKQICTPNSHHTLVSFLKKHPNANFRIGAGLSGVSGGAVPKENEIYIDLNGLKSIQWFDKESGILVAEPGITMRELLDFVRLSGWDFPVVPGSLDKATLGGMIACNGGGPLSLKFGKIGRHLLQLSLITASGEEVVLGGLSNKISEGLDTKFIAIGSEGTLGILTKIIMRCTPRLPELKYYRIAAEEAQKLMGIMPLLLQHDPYLLEYASPEALKFTSQKNEHVFWTAFDKNIELPFANELKITEEDATILNERFQIGHKLQAYKPFIDLDVSFSVKHAYMAILELGELLNKNTLEHIVFGHAGDGNYHIHVFFDNNRNVWEKVIPQFDAIIEKYDGSITGEHGIGEIHKTRFQQRMRPWDIAIYRQLKQLFDPNNQLPKLI